MSVDIIMPHMGESVVEGKVLKWLKAVGQRVGADEPLVEIGTDKINVEVPSPEAGVLLEVLAQEGDVVKVEQRIAVVGEAGEAPAPKAGVEPGAAKPTASGAGPFSREPIGERVPSERGAAKRPVRAKPRPAPPAPREAPAEAAAPAPQAPPPIPPPPQRPRVQVVPTQGPIALGTLGVLASPAVRRLARERLVDLGKVKGTGRMGRITREDVLEYLQSARPRAAPPAAPAEAAPAGEAPPPAPPAGPRPDVDEELVPLTPMRRAVAEHMVRSKHVAPHVTTVAEVDVTAVARLRERWRAERPEAGALVTWTALVSSAVARALREHPALNASWTEKGVLFKYRIHLGLAVAVEEGLVVPVIRDADRMTLLGLARAVRSVAEKTRAGKVSPSDLTEGTFTITNPGVFGAVLSTPIIHQPQAAILAIGRVADVAAVVDGGIAVRKHMYLSLSYDHRVVDGATAVGFLRRIRQILEEAAFDLA
jgi:2-oxoglutarate dehydrogenase E2 component (dihydrolipoamide succinyltransferase)